MKLDGNIMLDKMSDVDEKLILAADNLHDTQTGDNTHKKIRRKFFITGAAAAAVMVAAAMAITFIPWKTENHVAVPDLPMLSVPGFGEGGFGMEAIGSSRLEIEKANSIGQDFSITEMPVYASSSISAETADKMKEKLKETAEYFGLDLADMDINDTTFPESREEEFRKSFKEEYGAPDEEIDRMIKEMRIQSSISASTLNYSDDESEIQFIDVGPDMEVTIRWNWGPDNKETHGIELPEGYSFGKNSTPEELEEAGRYLLEKYSDLINMTDPAAYKSEYKGYAAFYEKGANTAESLANREIKRVEFRGENNKLTVIRIYEEYTLCEKIADYPISTVEEAEKLLRNGNYLSSVPYDVKADDEIGLAELTYRSGRGYECVMPFYRFYVKLPEEEFGHEEGDDKYGAFYVPAVRKEYLENLPAAAISFNGSMIK